MHRRLKNPARGLLLAALVAAGCDSPPMPAPQDMASSADLPPPPPVDMTGATCAPFTGELAACSCSAEDYAPRFQMSSKDSWPACVSDENTYKLAGMNTPSTAARTRALVSIGEKLWKNANAPTAQNFTDARAEYAVAEGIGSRVQRRQDIHYPEIPENTTTKCTDAAIAAMYPDRCVGPQRLLPILNDAFQAGQAGMNPRVNAARIEAALLWFFHISIMSEHWTCSFSNIADCDSAWAYYTADSQRGQPLGLAQYVNELSPETHNRVFDGLLAARCWRDIDKALPTTRMDLYRRASEQTDKAATRGMALILRDRLGKLQNSAGDVQAAHLAFINIIGGFLDRAARAINAQQADVLKAQVSAATAGAVDVAKARAAIDAIFACP